MKRAFLLCVAALLLAELAACGGSAQIGSTNTAPAAIEAYLQALVDKDSNRMINLSCPDWEAQARQEFDSFAAVKARLDQPQCQESGAEGSFTLVACTGKIIANYGAEDLEINLSDQVYQAVQDGGEWRMCGYH